jgi:hypothetical protein
MSAGIKANNDGSAAIQVGGSDYIEIASTGPVTIPGNLTVTGTATVNGVPVGGNYILNEYTSPAPWDAAAKKTAGLKAVKVTIIGGGGGGAGGRGTQSTPGGPGTATINGAGGPSEVGFAYIPAASIPTSPFTIEAGAGGAGGVGPASFGTRTNGASGGTSSFSSFVSVTGGQGGTSARGARGAFTSPVPASQQLVYVNPPTPVTPGNGPIINALNVAFAQGYGFDATNAVAGVPYTSSPGAGLGAAGAGAPSTAGTPPAPAPVATGGNGTPGIVIVEEFY